MLPGWLAKRARDIANERNVTVYVNVLAAPVTPTSAAIYLLEVGRNYELHVVDDAETGIDGTTLHFARPEMSRILSKLAGALSGREPSIEIYAGVRLLPTAAPESPVAETPPV